MFLRSGGASDDVAPRANNEGLVLAYAAVASSIDYTSFMDSTITLDLIRIYKSVFDYTKDKIGMEDLKKEDIRNMFNVMGLQESADEAVTFLKKADEREAEFKEQALMQAFFSETWRLYQKAEASRIEATLSLRTESGRLDSTKLVKAVEASSRRIDAAAIKWVEAGSKDRNMAGGPIVNLLFGAVEVMVKEEPENPNVVKSLRAIATDLSMLAPREAEAGATAGSATSSETSQRVLLELPWSAAPVDLSLADDRSLEHAWLWAAMLETLLREVFAAPAVQLGRGAALALALMAKQEEEAAAFQAFMEEASGAPPGTPGSIFGDPALKNAAAVLKKRAAGSNGGGSGDNGGGNALNDDGLNLAVVRAVLGEASSAGLSDDELHAKALEYVGAQLTTQAGAAFLGTVAGLAVQVCVAVALFNFFAGLGGGDGGGGNVDPSQFAPWPTALGATPDGPASQDAFSSGTGAMSTFLKKFIGV